MAHWKPFRGSLSFPAFARIRPIYPYFSRLGQSERRETGLPALLKRCMISHTHLKTSYLPDTTPLIKRPASWQPSSSCETAPGLAGPRGPPKAPALPHAGVWKASSSMPGCDWHPRSLANQSCVPQWKKKIKIFGSPAGANVKVMPSEASLKLLPLHGPRFSARLTLGWPEDSFSDQGVSSPASALTRFLLETLRCVGKALLAQVHQSWFPICSFFSMPLTLPLLLREDRGETTRHSSPPRTLVCISLGLPLLVQRQLKPNCHNFSSFPSTWWMLTSYLLSRSIRRTRCSRVPCRLF